MRGPLLLVVGVTALIVGFKTQDWALIKANFAAFAVRQYLLSSLSFVFIGTGVLLIVHDHLRAFDSTFGPTSPAGLRTLRAQTLTGLVVVLVIVSFYIGAAWLAHLHIAPQRSATAQPGNASAPPARPGSVAVDFASWMTFGGIAAQISDDPAVLRLDTHDTVATWATKWSGVIAPATSTWCAMRMTGRVRDLTHAIGAQGGFGLGLGSFDAGADQLDGIAVQYDFGFSGYRTVNYPSDLATDAAPAALDNAWHDVDVSIGADGTTVLDVDGVEAARSHGSPACGQPFIRVWGGAAEFSGFQTAPAVG